MLKKHIYDTIKSLSTHSVAIFFPCRNNYDKNPANFLESAQNRHTFAAGIDFHTIFCSFLLKIWFLVIGYLVRNEKGSSLRAFFISMKI